jgi:hypothetical protein
VSARAFRCNDADGTFWRNGYVAAEAADKLPNRFIQNLAMMVIAGDP